MSNFDNEAMLPQDNGNGMLKRVGIILGAGVLAAATLGALNAGAESTPRGCEIGGCQTDEVPNPTIAPDAEPIPGNQDSGDEADLDEELDDKGGDLTTSSTVAQSSTTSSTVAQSSTTSSTIPGVTTTFVSTPPTMPSITVTVPTVAEHTN